ncbi:MAG: transporter [Terriglobales bacterium]
MSFRRRFPLNWIFRGLVLCLSCLPAWAQEQSSSEASCFSTTIVSVPSRPTVTSAADPTQCGVVELEYGLERQWPGGGANRDDLSGGMRWGLTPNLDLHWSSTDFLHLMNGGGNRTGFGDTWLGLRYRFLKQTKHRPGMAFFYQAKIPSASVVLSLGSGRVDHQLSLLISKEIHTVDIDFNVIPLWTGRPAGSGFDQNVGFALSAAVPLTRRFGVVTEGYGGTGLNHDNPAFASTMLGFTYQAQPRLILDTGLDVGVTSGAPLKRVFVGVTYAVANLYAWMRPQR